MIAVTETWLDSASEDTFNLLGYHFFFLSRVNKRGGGVGIYLRDNFFGSIITEVLMLKESIECVFIEIFSSDLNVIMGSVYQPPGSDVADFN